MMIVVTGSQGMLGTDMVQILSNQHHVVGWDLHNCNILEPDQVDRMAALVRPEAIIHAAAYTNVDLAESEPEAAMRLNATGTENVARAAQKYDCHMVISALIMCLTAQRLSHIVRMMFLARREYMGKQSCKESRSCKIC